jgi:hypothetical protein
VRLNKAAKDAGMVEGAGKDCVSKFTFQQIPDPELLNYLYIMMWAGIAQSV